MILRAKHQILLSAILAASLLPAHLSAQTSAPAATNTINALLLSDIHFDPSTIPQRSSASPPPPSPPGPPSSLNPIPPINPRPLPPCSIPAPRTSPTPPTRCSPAASAPPTRNLRTSASSPSPATLSPTTSFAASAQLVPGQPQQAYAAFVEKTTQLVLAELRRTFPGIPIYIALGNNDSDCGNYMLDPHGLYLKQTAALVADALGPIAPNEHKAILTSFSNDGSYSVTLPAPMENTRLIVLDNVLLVGRFTTCANHPDPAAAAQQITWLQQQLADARQHSQNVWVMGHVPPGIDLYSTVTNLKNFCAADAPAMFLGSDAMANTLIANSDEVRVALFAHTHMDELRLLTPEPNSTGGSVPIKVVPSITAVHGNNPSFTVARIDPVTATMVDYAVFSTATQTGVNATWTQQYDFDDTYHQDAFSALALQHLTAQFQADPHATTAASRAYLGHYFAGNNGLQLTPMWPWYVCSLTHTTAQGFAGCACQNK